MKRIHPTPVQGGLNFPPVRRPGRPNQTRIRKHAPNIIILAAKNVRTQGRVQMSNLCDAFQISRGSSSYNQIRELLLKNGFNAYQVGLADQAPAWNNGYVVDEMARRPVVATNALEPAVKAPEPAPPPEPVETPAAEPEPAQAAQEPPKTMNWSMVVYAGPEL